MKRIICITIFLLLAAFTEGFTEGFSEVIVPPPPIDIDISNSSFEKIGSTQFRIRHLTAPAYPGSYLVDFLWNRDQLLFQPTGVDEETSSPSGIKVAFVSKSGEHYSDPIAAMNDIASWCGTPSETNPCLVKILPGVYDIETNTLQMQPYVDIEGSGSNITKIKGNGSNGVVGGAQNSEIRSLIVEYVGDGSDRAVAMHMFQSTPSLKDMTITTTGNNSENYGVLLDTHIFELPDSLIELKNVKITVSGGSANYGVYNSLPLSRVLIEHSAITGTTNSVYTKSGVTLVGNTRLEGTAGGNTTCAGIYDENFTFYANTCP